jgi:hypothetical protein
MWLPAFTVAVALTAQATPPAAPAAPEVVPWPDSRPLTRLFHNLAADIRHLPSLPSLHLLAAGTAATLGARAGDDATARWASAAGPSSYPRIGDLLGVGAVQGGAALATYAVGKLTHRPAITHVGGDLIRGQVLTALMTQSLKYGVGRTRPDGGSRSFPSGHTSATFVSATVLGQHFGWKVAAPAYATATFVAWSRIREEKHYPSDVVVGATLGLVVGTTVTRGHRAWAVVPVRTTGGFAVYVVRD